MKRTAVVHIEVFVIIFASIFARTPTCRVILSIDSVVVDTLDALSKSLSSALLPDIGGSIYVFSSERL